MLLPTQCWTKPVGTLNHYWCVIMHAEHTNNMMIQLPNILEDHFARVNVIPSPSLLPMLKNLDSTFPWWLFQQTTLKSGERGWYLSRHTHELSQQLWPELYSKSRFENNTHFTFLTITLKLRQIKTPNSQDTLLGGRPVFWENKNKIH